MIDTPKTEISHDLNLPGFQFYSKESTNISNFWEIVTLGWTLGWIGMDFWEFSLV